MKALENYSWPGNVRQLRNVIERMVVLADGDRLTIADIPDEITNVEATAPTVATIAPIPATSNAAPTEKNANSLADAEKNAILNALEKSGYNKTKAAERLGISRRTLHRKLKEWSIEK